MKLLLVEDDSDIAQMIADGLAEDRYTVEIASDGTRGYELARDGGYSLILLDVMLPGMDGWQICAALRSRRITTPILMLTARDAVPDRVKGLEAGADDYLPKPFDFTELRARIRSLLRRDKVHKARGIRIGDLEIDTVLRRVLRAGQEILLTPREYALLEALALREGQTLSRETLQQLAWDDEEIYSNAIDVRMAALRKKIDPAGTPVKLIHTVHGIGYVLRRPPEDDQPGGAAS